MKKNIGWLIRFAFILSLLLSSNCKNDGPELGGVGGSGTNTGTNSDTPILITVNGPSVPETLVADGTVTFRVSGLAPMSFYHISWNDLSEGDGTQTADILVSVTDKSFSTPMELIVQVDNGYTNAVSFFSWDVGPIEVLVEGVTATDEGTFEIWVESRPVCGDNILSRTEQCDDGNKTNGDGCSGSCIIETVCGDNIFGGNEECEDGNLVNGDGCNDICQIEACGNARLDFDEECDDGNLTDNDGCSFLCVAESGSTCGNSILEPSENCDDGNLTDNDGCSSLCTIETVPSDSLSGMGNTTTSSDYLFTVDIPIGTTEVSIASLWLAGNFWLSNEFASVYAGDCFLGDASSDDDGAILIEDTAFRDMTIPPSCWTAGTPLVFTFRASPAVDLIPYGADWMYRYWLTLSYYNYICGNNIIEAGELCDDGNQINGDGCEATCEPGFIYVCGNGIQETPEECDDGNLTAGDGCNADCKNEICGNLVLDAGEQCDDGNTLNNDGCSSKCINETQTSMSIVLGTPVVGSLFTGFDQYNLTFDVNTNQTYVVRWDDSIEGTGAYTATVQVTVVDDLTGVNLLTRQVRGYATPFEFVSASTGTVTIIVEPSSNSLGNIGTFEIVARTPICGDGIVDSTENCDDANTTSNDGCSNTCTFEGSNALTMGAWESGQIVALTDFANYSFTATGGVTYRVQWNSQFSGDGTQTGRILVTVTGDTSGTVYLNAQSCCYDWNKTFTAPTTETVTVLVEPMSTTSTTSLGTYQIRAKAQVCGDGDLDTFVLPAETCDDGNTVNGDGCDSLCQIEKRPLTLNTWTQGVLTQNVPVEEYTLNTTIGEVYRAWWNDSGDGDGTQTGDVDLLATDDLTLTNLIIFGNSGWTTPREIVPVSNGPVTLRFETSLLTSYGTYQFMIERAACGDSIIDAGLNEDCDDGNQLNGDGCSSSCFFEPFFASFDTWYSGSILGQAVPGQVFRYSTVAGNEYRILWNDLYDGDGTQTLNAMVTATDKISGVDYFTNVNHGWSNPITIVAGNTGDMDVVVRPITGAGTYEVNVAIPVCGDGYLDTAEQCDDGNTANGDWCTSLCISSPVCGDSFVDLRETCDDGNTVNNDGCSSLCLTETVCGNGVLNWNEQCDDNNTANGDGCSSLCMIESVCGDTVIEGAEQCDDGNTNIGDGCDATCIIETVCGDGIVNGAEECDDDNTFKNDICDNTCLMKVMPTCGNKIVEAGETCDDGNTAAGDGCNAACQNEGLSVQYKTAAGRTVGKTSIITFDIPAGTNKVSIDSLWIAGDFRLSSDTASVTANGCFLGDISVNQGTGVLVRDTLFDSTVIGDSCWTAGQPLSIVFVPTVGVNTNYSGYMYRYEVTLITE